MENTSQLLKLAEIQGRGRGLVSKQPLKPGQVILKDSPLLLYSASTHHHKNHNNTFCSNCFKIILQSPVPCPFNCTSSFFCSSTCQSIASSSSHTHWVCQSFTHLQNTSLLVDQQIQARFLVSAYNLAVISPSAFRVLLSLQGDPSFISEDEVVLFHSLVGTLCPSSGEFGFTKQLTAALLAKDKVNAFGLMEPFDINKERGVRAYGIYPMASFFNHDCLPNACRFEYVDGCNDGSSSNNTDIIVRAIHEVPEGREICLSYFPVNFKYSERQRRLKEDYGFTCNCDRCVVEANWSDEEDDAMDNEGEEEEDETMEEDVDEEVEENGEVEEERDQDFPHSYFFLRYMCNRENCWGTLAPLPPPDASPSTVMECNVCGKLSKADELMVGAGDH